MCHPASSVTAPRGVGKTALLTELAGKAAAAGWLGAYLDASGGARRARGTLARELAVSARTIKEKHLWARIDEALPTIASFSASVGAAGSTFDVKGASGRADSGILSVDVEELIEDVAGAAKADGKALALFIDEMQALDGELLEALLTSQHTAGQRGLPFFVIGAGLPCLPSQLAVCRSYAERLFDYYAIGR